MTSDDLLILVERAEAHDRTATGGPWRQCLANQPNGCLCGLVWSVATDHPVMSSHNGDETGKIDKNTAFTADARADLPRLARVGRALLDLLAWHEKRASQLRAMHLAGTMPNAIDFAEVHEASVTKIRGLISNIDPAFNTRVSALSD